MKADNPKYLFGVCAERLFDNTIKFRLFACDKCKTHFIRDNFGIKIAKEPPDSWKRMNKNKWNSVEQVLSISNDNYIENFDNLD